MTTAINTSTMNRRQRRALQFAKTEVPLTKAQQKEQRTAARLEQLRLSRSQMREVLTPRVPERRDVFDDYSGPDKTCGWGQRCPAPLEQDQDQVITAHGSPLKVYADGSYAGAVLRKITGAVKRGYARAVRRGLSNPELYC